MKRLVVGILAHVDSGKTTLSEGLLYQAGALRRLGRVDHQDAFLDTHELERGRGITIFSKQALLHTENAEFTLLDTPGHVDFSAEMERTLQVLDYAILVISGTDGVQSHTETLWRLLERYRIPTFLFINKMDLAGAECAWVLAQLKARLSEGCVDFAQPQTQGDEAFFESLALCGDVLMERFLETGTLEEELIRTAIARRWVFPCYFGSALKLQGVDELLAGLDRYTRSPAAHSEFGARVYKIATDEQGVRLTYLKVTGGVLNVKDTLQSPFDESEPWAEKTNQLRVYSGSKYQAVETALPGMVCAVTGLSHTRPGQGLGAEAATPAPLLQPVLTYRVELPHETDPHTALTQLRQLEQEDPALQVVWNERLQEIHLRLMGEVQLEIIKSLLFQRFGLSVSFGPGSIVYKETIAAPVEGVGHFEPLRHYAEVHLLLEPGARGSGLTFANTCREDALDKNWQRLILTHLQEKTHLGVLTGAPVTDLKITLTAGRAHLKHTEGGDFRQATYRAVRQGLKSAQSLLLEPWYDFRLELPQENLGRTLADLQRMCAVFSAPDTDGQTAQLSGSAPVAELQGYQLELNGYTHGRGRLICNFKGYEPCHNAAQIITAIDYNSDADLENPADSVFCAHGAGFVVKWNEVPAHMHLSSCLDRPAAEDEPQLQTVPQRAAAYCAGLEQDRELLRIFERTYGPLKRDPRLALRSPRQDSAEKGSFSLRQAGEEYLLVDGYNIIFAWEDLSALARESLDSARQRLIDLLCNYQGFRPCTLILVFDAYKVKGHPGEVEQVHNISVVYTKEAETADMYIEKATHKLARQNRVRVVTSDGMEQLIILGQGALRVSAGAFREEVDLIEREIRGFLESQPVYIQTISPFLFDKFREKLTNRFLSRIVKTAWLCPTPFAAGGTPCAV